MSSIVLIETILIGISVGAEETDGIDDGISDGYAEGVEVGLKVGDFVGSDEIVGGTLGDVLGEKDGFLVGCEVIATVGWGVGD